MMVVIKAQILFLLFLPNTRKHTNAQLQIYQTNYFHLVVQKGSFLRQGTIQNVPWGAGSSSQQSKGPLEFRVRRQVLTSADPRSLAEECGLRSFAIMMPQRGGIGCMRLTQPWCLSVTFRYACFTSSLSRSSDQTHRFEMLTRAYSIIEIMYHFRTKRFY